MLDSVTARFKSQSTRTCVGINLIVLIEKLSLNITFFMDLHLSTNRNLRQISDREDVDFRFVL